MNHQPLNPPPSPPCRFKLDFGSAFGGSYTAGAIKAWLDPFLRQTAVGMLLWPRRIVVPILPEEVTGDLSYLFLRRARVGGKGGQGVCCAAAALPILAEEVTRDLSSLFLRRAC